MKINASIVVMDADSNRVLYEENKDKRMLIASTTKIMTTIIALENASLNDIYKVGEEINNTYGSMTYIKKGEKFTLNDLLHGLMLRSGNDSAMTIASNVTNYETFIKLMNLKAYSLNMKNTEFNNPHGLDEETQNISSAYDLSLLMSYAIKNKNFLNITQTKKYKVNDYIWHNKNKLLNDYEYALSGKIGYTTKSGQVFVSYASKDNKNIVISTIKESDKFNLHKKLYEKYFDSYKKYHLLDKNTFNFEHNNNYYYIKNDFYMLLKEHEKDNLTYKIVLTEKPKLHIYLDNKYIHTEHLYKKEKPTKLNKILSFFKK